MTPSFHDVHDSCTIPGVQPSTFMQNAPDAARRPVNLLINARTLELAKELGINLSQTVDSFLSAEVQRRYWERWNEENKAAIDAYNARVAEEELPLARYRSF